jgi:hypothetical protein
MEHVIDKVMEAFGAIFDYEMRFAEYAIQSLPLRVARQSGKL